MNDFFASIYENLVYNQVYSMDLFTNGSYLSVFLSMILPSVTSMAVFYFLIKYPYCRWFHWLIFLATSVLVTGIVTYNILAENLAVYILTPDQYPDVNAFISTFIVYNLVLSVISGIVFTLIFKQAPLPQRNVPFGGK